MDWNFGDILDAVEPLIPEDAPAFIHGSKVITIDQARRATNNIARGLIARGAQPGDKLAVYMRNRPEYLMSVAAAWKARQTHVNVNYRYTGDEVWYIFDNSDARIVVYTSEFRDIVAQIRPRLPKVHTWIEVSDEQAVAPFAEPFANLAAEGDGSALSLRRSGDDQFFVYTGGTTGMPKGVMWTHGDLREISLIHQRKFGPVPETMAELREHVRKTGAIGSVLPAPPLMHSTALIIAMGVMLSGGTVITLESGRFDPAEFLDAVARHRPITLVIVGDSFGRPILDALNEKTKEHWDLSSVQVIISSGVMWSYEVKQGLLAHMPGAVLQDMFSSTEALGMGTSLMTRGAEVSTAKFVLGERCKVFDEDGKSVLPGSGVPGMVAIGPPNPLGYYKDPAKSAATFRTIGGVRYSMPGDWCLVEADGSLTLLGRGSACINTAGEKVFPEEVEEALKTHVSVADALVIGVADKKWGQAVVGVVRLVDGAILDDPGLRDHVRARLAGFKVPKRIIVADRELRTANGKADYPAARAAVEARL